MKVIIQCAASKRNDTKNFYWQGKVVNFVANPKKAPDSSIGIFVLPDDVMEEGNGTWRSLVTKLNQSGEEVDGLVPAIELYKPRIFGQLVNAFGMTDLFVLSAGWGLVRADFRIPSYNITLSKTGSYLTRRYESDPYQDFNQLKDVNIGSDEEIIFLGGKSYLPLLHRLLSDINCRKKAFYRVAPLKKSNKLPVDLEKYSTELEFIPFRTSRCTNWHYESAERLIEIRFGSL